ncbi:helix-turn-helix domain-containing protein [Streptomyces sp. NPDC051572]|uniref:AraC-like ligand-binding domain-containing protein n=1 Tax=unclassified Streptomyces TaxID=2593676 RepID=UPI00344DB12F
MEDAHAASADAWEQICSESFVPLRVGRISEGFRGSVTRVPVTPGVTVSEVRSGASQVLRTARLTRSTPSEDYLFVVHLGGVGFVEQDSRRALLPIRGGILYDSSRPYTLSFPETDIRELVLQVPRSLLGHGDRESRERCGHAISADIPALRVLGAMMTEILRVPEEAASEPAPDPSVGWAMGELLSSVLDTAFRPPAHGPQALGRTATLRVIQAHITEHLADPELTPATLAARHSVSLRHLHALFAETGTTPAAHIRQERLRLAHRQLSRPSNRHLTIAAIARRSGFTDLTTFTRAFRRAYDRTPSEHRAATLPTAGTASMATTSGSRSPK